MKPLPAPNSDFEPALELARLGRLADAIQCADRILTAAPSREALATPAALALAAIARRFDIVEHRTFLPFFWYLAPKLRLGQLRHPIARAFRAWDGGLARAGLARGAYFIVEARRRSRPSS